MKTQTKLQPVNLTQLRDRCNASIDELIATLPNVQTFTSDWGDRHWYIDNGSPILAVAHLDTVLINPAFDYREIKAMHGMKRDALVWSSQLDDRLGAYLLLDYLPALGMSFDVLLTENEEICQSTAYDFQPVKPYHWGFMFDRAGDEVVMYQYEDPQSELLLKESGAQLGIGSYSCITDLEHLGIKCFNWGCGYEGAHSPLSYTRLSVLYKQIKRFAKFYYAHKDTRLEHTVDLDRDPLGYARSEWARMSREYTRGADQDRDLMRSSELLGTCDYCGKRDAIGFMHITAQLCDFCYDLYLTDHIQQCCECGLFVAEIEFCFGTELCVNCAGWNERYAAHLMERETT